MLGQSWWVAFIMCIQKWCEKMATSAQRSAVMPMKPLSPQTKSMTQHALHSLPSQSSAADKTLSGKCQCFRNGGGLGFGVGLNERKPLMTSPRMDQTETFFTVQDHQSIGKLQWCSVWENNSTARTGNLEPISERSLTQCTSQCKHFPNWKSLTSFVTCFGPNSFGHFGHPLLVSRVKHCLFTWAKSGFGLLWHITT